MYYSLFALSLLSAPVWAGWLSRANNLFRLGLSLLVFAALALPTSYGTLRHYLTTNPASYVSWEELRALSLIEKQPMPVLSPLYSESVSRNYLAPKPLSAYESTAYISALSGAPSVIADEVNLTIMAYDYHQVRKGNLRLFATDDEDFAQQFLSASEVGWILQPDWARSKLEFSALDYRPVFDAGTTTVYTQNQ